MPHSRGKKGELEGMYGAKRPKFPRSWVKICGERWQRPSIHPATGCQRLAGPAECASPPGTKRQGDQYFLTQEKKRRGSAHHQSARTYNTVVTHTSNAWSKIRLQLLQKIVIDTLMARCKYIYISRSIGTLIKCKYVFPQWKETFEVY